MPRWATHFTIAAIAVCICFAPISTAQESAKADMKDIMRLMDLSGSANMGEQMLNQMMGTFQQRLPDVPQEFWDAYRAEMDMDELVGLIAPVYARHFTAADVQALIKFYESPVGKKMVTTQPMILQESMAIGQSYSQSVTMKLMDKLKAEGYMGS